MKPTLFLVSSLAALSAAAHLPTAPEGSVARAEFAPDPVEEAIRVRADAAPAEAIPALAPILDIHRRKGGGGDGGGGGGGDGGSSSGGDGEGEGSSGSSGGTASGSSSSGSPANTIRPSSAFPLVAFISVAVYFSSM